jgi:hypothetical protein
MGSEANSVDGVDTQSCKAGWGVLDARFVGWTASVDHSSDEFYKRVRRKSLRPNFQLIELKDWVTI